MNACCLSELNALHKWAAITSICMSQSYLASGLTNTMSSVVVVVASNNARGKKRYPVLMVAV